MKTVGLTKAIETPKPKNADGGNKNGGKNADGGNAGSEQKPQDNKPQK